MMMFTEKREEGKGEGARFPEFGNKKQGAQMSDQRTSTWARPAHESSSGELPEWEHPHKIIVCRPFPALRLSHRPLI